jgi:CheY-like chemotaxis protein
MGGEIAAHSGGEGAGSTFTFSVLLAPAEGAASKTYDLAPLDGKRVLIADASAATRRALALQALAWGMVPAEAASARGAVEALREPAPDLAIIDARLLEGDAAALVALISSSARTRSFAPILMSAVSDPRRPQRQNGSMASLGKPVKQSSLYDVLVGASAGASAGVAPAAAENGSKPAPRDELPAATSPLRILVAEDNPTNQRIVVQLLQRLGYGADLAANGVEALDAIQQRRYDVVLMDMMMPEMDGLAATRSIRETRPADEQPHIIAVTANVAAEARQQCFQAGMDDYLSKPVSVSSLRAALERAVSPRRPPVERGGVSEAQARS